LPLVAGTAGWLGYALPNRPYLSRCIFLVWAAGAAHTVVLFGSQSAAHCRPCVHWHAGIQRRCVILLVAHTVVLPDWQWAFAGGVLASLASDCRLSPVRQVLAVLRLPNLPHL